MAGFLRQLNTISRSTSLFRDERLSSYGLSGHQVKYLLAVGRAEGVSQDELSRSLFVNKSNVARQLSALEEAGFIRREQSPEDKRVYRVYTTAAARELLPVIRAVNAEWREILCAGLSPDEVEELTRLLSALVKNARGYAEGER